MEYESHYYAAGYGPDNDPYVMENGVLINKLGLTDTQTLNVIELRIASLEVDRILKEPLPSSFDLAYHRHLHFQIFHQVYPWAGELRKVDIGKGETLFLPHTQIETEATRLFSDLASDGFLKDFSHEDFCQKAGEYLVRLNHIHPFREGNGRSQRLLISRLAQHAGIQMDWSAVSNESMKRACIEGVMGNIRQMVRLILLNSKP